MPDTHPLVTVYVVNHNYGKYLEQCLDSIYNQTFRLFEVIVIDNGSSDDSRSRILRYKDYPDTRIIFQDNIGLNATANIALRLAKAPYLIRVDADDYLHSEMISLLYSRIIADPDVSVAFPDYYHVDIEGSILSHEKRHDFTSVELYDQPAHGACTLISVEKLRRSGGYSTEFTCQDGYELWLKMIRAGRVVHIDLPLFYYRQHPSSLSKNTHRLLATRSEIVKKHADLGSNHSDLHVAFLPIRGGHISRTLLADFNGRPLIDHIIEQVVQTELVSLVYISTDCIHLSTYLTNLNSTGTVKVLQRDPSLSSFSVPIDTVLHSHLPDIDANAATISVLSCEYPYRKSYYIDQAIRLLYLFRADSVVSVTAITDKVYQHNGKGLVPLTGSTDLRFERDTLYVETGGIHTCTSASFRSTGKVVTGCTTFLHVDQESSRALQA